MTNKPRFSVTIDPELVEEIEKYRHEHRISTQSKAIQQLLRIGIEKLKCAETPAPLTEDGPDAQERELIRIARGLDPAQKAYLLRLLELAAGSGEKRQTPE